MTRGCAGSGAGTTPLTILLLGIFIGTEDAIRNFASITLLQEINGEDRGKTLQKTISFDLAHLSDIDKYRQSFL